MAGDELRVAGVIGLLLDNPLLLPVTTKQYKHVAGVIGLLLDNPLLLPVTTKQYKHVAGVIGHYKTI